MKLANSLWPRTGGDPANRAKVCVKGPGSATIVWRHTFQGATNLLRGDIAVSDDGLLRVSFDRKLFAIEVGVGIKWVVPLDGEEKTYFSPPTALEQGRTLLVCNNQLVLVSSAGEIERRESFDVSLDDSGLSPCVLYDGRFVVTGKGGDVFVDGKEIGAFGYDVVPPAVFDDNSLGISGHSWSGYCRVGSDGIKRWGTSLKDADLVATVASSQYSAVGSLNDKRSEIFAPDGTKVGVYPRVAIFSEHLSEQWVALSETHLALLTKTGEIVWEIPNEVERRWGGLHAIVDQLGDIYAPTYGGFVCCSATGEVRFSCRLDGSVEAIAEQDEALAKIKKKGQRAAQARERRGKLARFNPRGFALIAPKQIAFLLQDQLYVIGE